MATDPDPLQDAVSALQNIKSEHRELLDRIAGDEGMAGETRRALIQHVLEEEDEHVQEIQGLVPREGEAREPDQPVRRAGRLSIGSLRRDPPPNPGPGSVGSLRPR